jgi:hypothetical protein
MEITGLSKAAHAELVLDREEASKVLRMLPLKYPEQVNLPVPMPTPDDVRIFRVTPTSSPCSITPKGSDTLISSPAENPGRS